MWKKIAIGVAVALVAFVAFVATRPDAFRIERKATLKAPPEKVFALVEDFHRWDAWSPWEKLDPAMKKTHSGLPKGVGAIYAWEGNGDVGKGRMTLNEAVAGRKIVIQLEFLEPFAATNVTTFTFAPGADGTSVTWAMEGDNTFISKLFGVFMDMDAMIGKDFEAGLANLKGLAEKT